MGDGYDQIDLGGEIGEAPILGGLMKRKDTGRKVHLFMGGLVVEDKDGTIVMPYEHTRVFTEDPPGFEPHEDPNPKVEWTFEREDGVRWSSGSIDRATPLAQLCGAAAAASFDVRLPMARDLLAMGEQVDFVQVAVTAHDLVIPGKRPMPWAEVTGIETGAEYPIFLSTASGDDLMLSPLRSVADAAVLVALLEQRF